MAVKKKAKRRIKRINGVLTVVYIDVETGQILSNLDGYELITSDGFSNTDSTTPTPVTEAKPTALPIPEPSNEPSLDPYSVDTHMINKYRKPGTGDFLKDLKGGIAELQERKANFGQGIKDAFGNLVGRVVGSNIPKEDINTGIKTGVDTVKDAAGNAITGAGEAVTSLVGGLFGGGNTDIKWNGNDGNLADPLVQTVSAAQEKLTFGLNVVDGHRTEEENRAAGGASQSQHLHGNAIDISIKDMSDAEKSALVTSLAESGAKRIGVYSGHTGLHVDMAEGYPPPAGFLFYPMFDGSKNNLGNAPSWFVQTAKGQPLPEAQQYIRNSTPTPPAALGSTQVASDTSGVNPKLLASVSEIKSKQGQQVIVDGQPIVPELVNSNGLEYDANNALVGYDKFGFPLPDYTPPEAPSTKLNGINNPATDKLAATSAPVPMAEPFKARRSEPIVETSAIDAVNAMATGIDPVKKAYLDTINYAEGNPANNQAFGVNQYFELGKDHPNTFNSEFNTSAAGKYQWTKPTWEEYSRKAGVNDFSNEEHQDRAAWKLAEDNYRAKTGGNLYDALLAKDPTAFTANANRWSSLPGGLQPRTELPELMSKFNEGLAKYSTPIREPLAPAPKIETPTGFMAKPKTGPRDISTPTPSRINNTIAKPTVSDKTSMLSDPTITKSKTGGFMPKNGSDKTSSSNSSPTVTPNRPATQSPKISGNNSNSSSSSSSSTPIAGKVKNAPKTNMVTSPSSSTKTSNTAKTPSNTKIADTGTKKEYSYNPSGR